MHGKFEFIGTALIVIFVMLVSKTFRCQLNFVELAQQIEVMHVNFRTFFLFSLVNIVLDGFSNH